MAVRNFWVTTQTSSRHTVDETGPTGEKGILTSEFFIRENGGITKAFTVRGRVHGNYLVLTVYDETKGGEIVAQIETERG